MSWERTFRILCGGYPLSSAKDSLRKPICVGNHRPLTDSNRNYPHVKNYFFTCDKSIFWQLHSPPWNSYHTPSNRQAELFNEIIVVSVTQRVAKNWWNQDMFVRTLTFACNTQVYWSTTTNPCWFLLSPKPPSAPLQSVSTNVSDNSLESMSPQVMHAKIQLQIVAIKSKSAKKRKKAQNPERHNVHYDRRVRACSVCKPND